MRGGCIFRTSRTGSNTRAVAVTEIKWLFESMTSNKNSVVFQSGGVEKEVSCVNLIQECLLHCKGRTNHIASGVFLEQMSEYALLCAQQEEKRTKKKRRRNNIR